MSNFTTLYNTAGLPAGTIARGRINDPAWLPMNGGLYLKADYPELDTTDFMTVGNNTVQTASGSINSTRTLTSVSYNTDYSRIVVTNGGGSNNLIRSLDGGLTWSNFTVPGLPAVAPLCSFVNNLFVVFYASGATIQFATSTDAVTWSSFTSMSGPSSPTGADFLDFSNSVYILGYRTTSGNATIATNATLSTGWVNRATSADASFNTVANNRRVQLGRLPNGMLMATTSTTIWTSLNGIDWLTQGGTGYTAVASSAFRVTDYGSFYSGTSNILGLNIGSCRNFLDSTIVTLQTNSGIWNNFRNFFTRDGGASDKVFFTESKFAEGTIQSRTLPVGSSSSTEVFMTPSRMIFLPITSGTTSVYYVNIDNTRFRLERPFMDGTLVDDAYIKAA
jgi:hypothetical protein